MTIREFTMHNSNAKEFVSASCARCFRMGKMIFHMRIEKPTIEQIERVRYRATRHDGRKGDHPITLIINRHKK